MAGRQHAKLLKQQMQLAKVDDESNESDEEKEQATSPFNPFDLLTEEDMARPKHAFVLALGQRCIITSLVGW